MENTGAAAYAPLMEVASPLAPQGAKAKVMVMQEAPKRAPPRDVRHLSLARPWRTRQRTAWALRSGWFRHKTPCSLG
ncbi:MAG: hypothetical protein NTX04_05905 [Verrucomicrobia bacterium]|nr:hypothetical protein [Verrucomicrobiota bacterium]